MQLPEVQAIFPGIKSSHIAMNIHSEIQYRAARPLTFWKPQPDVFVSFGSTPLGAWGGQHLTPLSQHWKEKTFPSV